MLTDVAMELPKDEVAMEVPKAEESQPDSVEKPSVVPSDDGVEEDANAAQNDDDDDEGAQEEDALFSALEHSEEEKEAHQPHDQPTDVHVAPTLLKSALETGQVKSDSEDEEKEEKKVDHHVHSRVSSKRHPSRSY